MTTLAVIYLALYVASFLVAAVATRGKGDWMVAPILVHFTAGFAVASLVLS